MATVPMRTNQGAGTWNTPSILKAGRAAILALDLLLLIAAIAGTQVHRSAMTTVGRDAAPSMIAAQHIKSSLADMDASAAHELLGPPGAMGQAVTAYEARRVEASKALIAAAENITYGESERVPILSLQVGLGSYERLVQKARDLHQSGNPGAVAVYGDAAAQMDRTLLPAADALDQANNRVLERTYASQSARSFAARAFVLLAGFGAILLLIAMQFFLSRRMRRLMNPLLLLATLLTFLLTLYAWHAMESERAQLKVAKEDAFTSIHALWQARALAYQAHGEESRYLLDPAHANEYEDAFSALSASLATLPTDRGRDQVLADLRRGTHVNNFTGFLADELNNITFPGEQAAAVASLATWEAYLDVDAKIGQFARAGQSRQAVELCLGDSAGQSNWAFDRFDQALLATLVINQKMFDASVEKGLSPLRGLEIATSIAAALIAICVWLGLAPRLREYA